MLQLLCSLHRFLKFDVEKNQKKPFKRLFKFGLVHSGSKKREIKTHSKANLELVNLIIY